MIVNSATTPAAQTRPPLLQKEGNQESDARPGRLLPELQLLVPANDVVDPEVSIVIPALNEALTIGQFVDWCHEGLEGAGIRGEIIIIDSSTDATAEIALA